MQNERLDELADRFMRTHPVDAIRFTPAVQPDHKPEIIRIGIFGPLEEVKGQLGRWIVAVTGITPMMEEDTINTRFESALATLDQRRSAANGADRARYFLTQTNPNFNYEDADDGE
jgi:hypothetical protein